MVAPCACDIMIFGEWMASCLKNALTLHVEGEKYEMSIPNNPDYIASEKWKRVFWWFETAKVCTNQGLGLTWIISIT